jgi:Fe-S-cluster containining protein
MKLVYKYKLFAMSFNLQALHNKVDTFFLAVQNKHTEHMACRSGCSMCCHQTLTLFPVEIAMVLTAVDELGDDAQAHLATRLGDASTTCPLLKDDRCTIYESRPTICRSHGLPIQYKDDAGVAQRDTCPLNFAGILPLSRVPDSDVLDIDRLNEVLVVANQLAIATQNPTDDRIDLAQALRQHLERSS